jgi:hypothetical protein
MANRELPEQPKLSGTGKIDLRLMEIVKLLARQAAREFAAETSASASNQNSVKNQNSISDDDGASCTGDK